ncbi:transglutaminase family protein [Ideonella livida]|uniref:DUF3488 domain-containing transglutaminase family protein n=1 Tax=Ideonella livida TaxID=2707176 RepID=A0A7C9TGV2_9BURK|nr:DUF3488 and transglutaminase-like domain-containing protein [Ideonella livida]NDY90079.1 DUF3488 domain-containing transglutaminase family protein [Ideonella livida]
MNALNALRGRLAAPTAPAPAPVLAPVGAAAASRETRDTWFMLGVIAWTVAPLLLRLPAWVGVLCATVLAWRGWLAWRLAPLPGRWTVLAVLVLTAGLTWWTERTLLGKQAGVMLLVVLMSLKTLELRARRDALVVFFLGFFLILTQFLYSQNLLTALGMLGGVWGWLTALTLAHMPSGRPPLRAAGGLALRAVGLGLPVMLALFFLFPRIGPLWGMPGDSGRTGLSDRLSLGEVAELATDDSIAMRLRFPDGVPPPQERYFRGPVLVHYDGRQWQAPLWMGRRANDAPIVHPQAMPNATRWRYEVTLEPTRIAWLPLPEQTLDTPEGFPPLGNWPVRPDGLGQWRLIAPLGERLKLDGVAWSAVRPRPGLGGMGIEDALHLPPGVHPRTQAWAEDFADELQAARGGRRPLEAGELVVALLRHIRSQSYSYTLAPPPAVSDAVDEFWLDQRAGFCEHYAAATVVILRSLGVPARLVTGYQGMDPQPVDGYWIVRQSQAHAWLEYWSQRERRWVRVDPTSAVAPERVSRGSALRPPAGLVSGALDAVSPGLQAQMRRWLEGMDNRWNQWILGFGAQQQRNLAQDLGLGLNDWTDLVRGLGLLASAAALAGAAWAWHQRQHQAPWARLQSTVCADLAALQVPALPSQSARQWAQLLRERWATTAQEPPAELRAALLWLLALDERRYVQSPPPGPAHYRQALRQWRPLARALRAAQRRLAK